MNRGPLSPAQAGERVGGEADGIKSEFDQLPGIRQVSAPAAGR